METLKKLKSVALIYSMALIVVSIGCGKQVDYVYNVVPSKHHCFKYKILDKKNLVFDQNGETLKWEDCPNVFGFSDNDVSVVINYIKKEIKNCEKPDVQ